MEGSFREELEKIAGAGNVWQNESMALHTTFRIGGPADWFIVPQTVEQAAGALKLCRERNIPVTVIGNGSNLLVRDGGIRGAVLALCGGMKEIRITGTRVTADSGVLLSALSMTAARAGLAGLEFAAGIPGTLGGGITMNAGAYGGELKDTLVSATVLTGEGTLQTLSAEELELGYRTSRIQRTGEIVLSADFELTTAEPSALLSKIRELSERRREKQPLEYPSAGSTFKRPEGHFAGKLIEDAGLRGFTVGGAQVSEKHCGFLINRGGAVAADVLELIRQVQERVSSQFGVELEPEVRIIGEDE